jgi:hypothetical protein
MYMRIVNGMNERSSWTKLPSIGTTSTMMCNGEIQNIIRTRHNPVQEGPSSYMREGLERHSVNSPLNPPKTIKTTTTAPWCTLTVPSLSDMMTPNHHSPRSTKRTPPIVIQEPTDFIDDKHFVVLGGMAPPHGKCSLPRPPCFSDSHHHDVDNSHEENDGGESEGVFVMDDV